jgi:hypothetical protein
LSTTTYGYGINDERVIAGSTIYPFTLDNTQGSTRTIVKHISANAEGGRSARGRHHGGDITPCS